MPAIDTHALQVSLRTKKLASWVYEAAKVARSNPKSSTAKSLMLALRSVDTALAVRLKATAADPFENEQAMYLLFDKVVDSWTV